MRVGLVVHRFPSPEHPYILEWVTRIWQSDIELIVIAEESVKNDREFKNLRRINLISAPELQLLLTGFLSAFWHPLKLLSMLKVLRISESGKWLTISRKAFEYLPLLSEDFDLIHFNAPQIAERRFELKDIFQAPELVSFRGQDFTFYPARFDRLLRESTRLHFISRFLIEQASLRGYEGSKHELIPPMVDTKFYSPSNGKANSGKDSRWVIFSAARLEWVKGWEFALQAVALLVERGWDVEYNIAGEGELKDLLLFTIDQLGIADRVHLLGWQSSEQVRDRMRTADIYLLTSVEEGFNNSVLQAQACGLPVICSNEGGLPENIVDGVTGLLAQSRDAWNTADKIESLFRDPGLLVEMQKNAVQHAQKFTIEEGAARFIKLYHSMADSFAN